MLSSLEGGHSREGVDGDYDAIFLRLLEDEESYTGRQQHRGTVLQAPPALRARLSQEARTGAAPQTETARERSAFDVDRWESAYADTDRGLSCTEQRKPPENALAPREVAASAGISTKSSEADLPEWIRREIYVRDGELVILRDRLERQQRELIALRNAQAATTTGSQQLGRARAPSWTADAQGHTRPSQGLPSGSEQEFTSAVVQRLATETDRLRARLAFREREISQLRELLAKVVSSPAQGVADGPVHSSSSSSSQGPLPPPPYTCKSAVKRTANVSVAPTTHPSRSKRAGVFFDESLLLLNQQCGDSLASQPPSPNAAASQARVTVDWRQHEPGEPSSAPALQHSRPCSRTTNLQYSDRTQIFTILTACEDSWRELLRHAAPTNRENPQVKLDNFFAQQMLALLRTEADLRECVRPIQQAMLMSYAAWKRTAEPSQALDKEARFAAALTVLDALLEHSTAFRDYFMDATSQERADGAYSASNTNGLMLEHLIELVVDDSSWVFWQNHPGLLIACFRIVHNLLRGWCVRVRERTSPRAPSATFQVQIRVLIESPVLRHIFAELTPDHASLRETACAALGSAFAVENALRIYTGTGSAEAQCCGWQAAAVQSGSICRVLRLVQDAPLPLTLDMLGLVEAVFLGPCADTALDEWITHVRPEDRFEALEDLVIALERLWMPLQELQMLFHEPSVAVLDERYQASPKRSGSALRGTLTSALERWQCVAAMSMPRSDSGTATTAVTKNMPLPEPFQSATVQQLQHGIVGVLALLYRWTQPLTERPSEPDIQRQWTISADKENRERSEGTSVNASQVGDRPAHDWPHRPEHLRASVRARLRDLLRSLRLAAADQQRQRTPAADNNSSADAADEMVVPWIHWSEAADALEPLLRAIWCWLHPADASSATVHANAKPAAAMPALESTSLAPFR